MNYNKSLDKPIFSIISKLADKLNYPTYVVGGWVRDLILKKLIDVKEDGTFRLNMKYFNYATGLTMTNKNFYNLFNEPVRDAKKDKLTQFHPYMADTQSGLQP